MVKIPNMFKENVEYELIPAGEDQWHIRILKDEFIETVISFGQIKVDESSDQLKFDFTVEYTPDDYVTAENLELQRVAGKILESVIMNNLEPIEEEL